MYQSTNLSYHYELSDTLRIQLYGFFSSYLITVKWGTSLEIYELNVYTN